MDERKLNDQELWDQLTRASDLRSNQDSVLWSVIGAFAKTNAVLFVALFTTGKLPDDIVGFIISLFSCVLMVVWYLLLKKALFHLVRHEKLMKRIEDKLNISLDLSCSVNGIDYYKKLPAKGRFQLWPNFEARYVMLFLTIFSIAVWAILLIIFSFMILLQYNIIC